jgi:integral membrane protein
MPYFRGLKYFQMKSNTLLKQFSAIAIIEGISYLILVFIAMPLKYAMDMPQYVSWVGRVHGGLVVAYVIWLYLCHTTYKWDLKFSIKGFLLSLIPFGAFIFDKELKAQM